MSVLRIQISPTVELDGVVHRTLCPYRCLKDYVVAPLKNWEAIFYNGSVDWAASWKKEKVF